MAGRPQCSAKRTLDNLRSAMEGEAFAYAKYNLYAKHARRTDQPEVAALFVGAAEVELREHFAEQATLAGLVRDHRANLQDAIAGERYEASTMYPSFAQQAEQVGDRQAADRFTEIAKDEHRHAKRFEAALRHL